MTIPTFPSRLYTGDCDKNTGSGCYIKASCQILMLGIGLWCQKTEWRFKVNSAHVLKHVYSFQLMVTLHDVQRSEFLVFISKDTAFQV